MKSILMTAVVAITMFGAAAGASWKWRQMKLATAISDDHTDENGGASQSNGDSAASPHGRPVLPATNTAPLSPSDHKAAPARESPPRVAVYPSHTPGVEETVQLASSLRDRAAVVRERESQLLARQKQLELIAEDIRSERAAIDELRKQLDDALKAGEDQMTELTRQRTELEIKQQNIDGRVTEMAGQEKDNIKKMGSVYDNMAPESAAKILQQMADSGTMDTAVKLLAVMKERQAAKVLAEMPDPTLAAQLSERLKDLKRPAAAAKK